jgi:ankyrin repeat protein
MHAAESNSNSKVFTALLKSGADVNARDKSGQTVLIFAAKRKFAWRNTAVIMSTLLLRGADINAQNKNGKTALMYAAALSNRRWETVSLLLKSVTDARLKDKDGRMAIDYAEKNPKLRNAAGILKKLRKAGE